jgi:hypothetical protein
MTIHQCPKCELRFDWKTELDDHCWHDHPEFRHEYPAQPAPPPVADAADIAARRAQPLPQAPAHIDVVDGLLGWLVPARPANQPEIEYAPNTPESQDSRP